MSEKTYGKWRQLFVYAVTAVGLYVGIRCLFEAAFPFVTAFFLAKLFYPVVAFLKKKMKVGKGVSVLFLFLLVAVVILGGCWYLVRMLLEQAGEIIQNAGTYEKYADTLLGECCCRLERITGLRAEKLRPLLTEHIYAMTEQVKISLRNGVVRDYCSYAGVLLKVVGVCIVMVVVTVLLVKDYDKLHAQLKNNPFYMNIRRIKEKVFHAAFVYIRAQLVIMAVVCVVCCVTLLCMGIRHALLWGTGIGIMDAFPFIGTGSFLIPWAVICLVQGEFLRAALLVTLYLVCSFLREFLEPKLIGRRLGILPVYVVAVIYLGLVLYGVAGVVLGPLHALLTMEIGRQWIEEHRS